MASQRCPYCNTLYRDDPELRIDHAFGFSNVYYPRVHVFQHVCPECDHVAVTVMGNGHLSKLIYSFPPASAMHLPDYIPEAIRQDYLEAIQIADLSPKASATLARRCLQGMIHDFWDIKEKNLNAEITALKNHIPGKQWDAIDALRKLGNIGAHMENDAKLMVDVDPDEAKKLLKVIELLFKTWYIARHDDEQLLDEVCNMASEKDAARSLTAKDTNGQ